MGSDRRRGLRSAQQQLDRADALIDRESDPGTLSQGATLPVGPAMARDGDSAAKLPPPPDHLETGPARSAFPHPISQALETITDARMRLVRDNDSLGCALMLDELVVTNP